MPAAPARSLVDRISSLRDRFRPAGIGALVVTHLPNITYLTNFSGSAAVLLVTTDDSALITDFRYVTAARALLSSPHAAPPCRLVPVDHTYDETTVECLRQLGSGRIGVEGAYVPVQKYERWRAALAGSSATLATTDRLVEEGRIQKDAYEQQTLREAARRLVSVAQAVLGLVAEGRKETDLAADIDFALRRSGFERPAFETIVASGPTSAFPHARPGDRRLAPGDLVMLDFGGVYDGYCVDLTRTVSLGPADSGQKRLHDAVARAHSAALAATRPGVRASEVDAAARDTLTRLGLGEAFGHSTGHGLGLEVHEEPRIAKRRADAPDQDLILKPGMVFTVEPGAYVPGTGGVRIEDDVLVTESGCEVLTEGVTRDLEPHTR
jgi:Xaa-Pro aminopeptidase